MIRIAPALLVLVTTAVGCAPAEPPKSSEDLPEVAPTAERLPAIAYVPAAGLRWLVHVKPQKLMKAQGFAHDWSPVFNADRVRAFTQASGFAPEHVEEAWIAGYDLGVLYIFDGKIVGNDAETAFRNRALTTQVVESDLSDIVHVTGMIDKTPHALLHIKGHIVAIAEGDIQLVRIARAYAEGKLARSPSALEGRFLAPLASFAHDDVVRAFSLGPFEEATDAVVGGFVSGALGVKLEEGRLDLSARAYGVWPDDSDVSPEMNRWLDEVLRSRALRALGWGFPLSAPKVVCEKAEIPGSTKTHGQNVTQAPISLVACHAKGSWDSVAVARSLHRITAGSMQELMANESRSGTESRAPRAQGENGADTGKTQSTTPIAPGASPTVESTRTDGEKK